jgi:hypothetical protein
VSTANTVIASSVEDFESFGTGIHMGNASRDHGLAGGAASGGAATATASAPVAGDG